MNIALVGKRQARSQQDRLAWLRGLGRRQHHASEDGVVFPVRRLNERFLPLARELKRESGEFTPSCTRFGPRFPHSEQVVSQSFKLECPSRRDTTSIELQSLVTYFDNEIDFASSESLDGKKVVNVIPQKINFVFPVCHGVIVPASGRRLDLGCPTGNHAFFVLCSFTNQVLAKLDLMRSVVLASSLQERRLPLAETARCVSCAIAPSFIRSSAHRLCSGRLFRTSLFLQRATSTSTLWTT